MIEAVWEFYGFESALEGRAVQDWYDALAVDAQLEIVNLITHLQVTPGGRWLRPDYDPLEGESGISELRPNDIRTTEGNFTYRIYGRRGHPDKHCYTFLHGTKKDVKNDALGKAIAKSRLQQLARGEATVHRFNF